MRPLYEWDALKAKANIRKHGVSFEEAVTALDDVLSLTIGDRDHSSTEARYITLGISDHGRLLVVGHTARHERTRIISARRASPLERRRYEAD
jgi:uncharacterized DUF497 family protein